MPRTETVLTTQTRQIGASARRAEATLTEVFPAVGAEAAASNFILAQVGYGAAPVLWIQDQAVQRETGRPFLAGLGLCRPLMLMRLAKPVDVLIAVEEALRCQALAAVVAEIRGNPPAVNFTTLRRLALRAEADGVSCWLIRQSTTPEPSAARDRWRITSLPSAVNLDDPRAPGDARWRVDLFRSRNGRPGAWVARHERGIEGAADRLDLVATVFDGSLDAARQTAGQRTAG